MKKLLLSGIAMIAMTGFALADSAIFGSGATANSGSSSGVISQGANGAGAVLAGVAFGYNSAYSNQSTSGTAFGLGGTIGFASGAIAGSETQSEGYASFGSVAGALGGAGAIAGGEFSTVNGSDSNGSAFGGFGFEVSD